MTMLLYKLAVAPLTPAAASGWFTITKTPGVTDDWADVLEAVNDLTDGLLPQRWTLADDAKVTGLHDDDEITSDDPRFNGVNTNENVRVVRNPNGAAYLFMDINAPEALLLPEVALKEDGTFATK